MGKTLTFKQNRITTIQPANLFSCYNPADFIKRFTELCLIIFGQPCRCTHIRRQQKLIVFPARNSQFDRGVRRNHIERDFCTDPRHL